jgi:hypothetical protein
MANRGLHKKPYCTVPAVCLSYDDGDDRYVATTIRYKTFLKCYQHPHVFLKSLYTDTVKVV